MLQPGQTFASRYRVRRCIAEGGMGAIFEAEHLATERRVALKLLFPHIMSVASARQKFELEAKVSARVNSPFIVEVLDAGFDEASKSPYLVMELLEGQTLAARVREQGPFGVDETLRLLEQVAAGLDAAHGYKEAGGAAKPIVHRDLKPENLFLARQHDGSVVAKILDYGIAKVLGDTAHISQEVRGTPLYMAFEQVTAGALSPQTDVWALGLIAFHMLSGARYWRSAERQGSSVQSLFAEILTLPLEPPSQRLREQNLDVALPAAFDTWLLRCIDREPSKRFPSAGAAIEALGRAYERAPRAAARASLPLTRSSDKTQTFIAADVAARAAAAAAAAQSPATSAPATALGSVPALSATRHRRSLPSRMMASPLHWAAVGAGGGVLLLGGIFWLATREPAPADETPAPAAEPASSVQASRPAAQPGASAAPPAAARPPSSRPATNAAGEPAVPRIRIAPLDETPGAASTSAPSEPGVAADDVVGADAVGADSPARGGSRAAGSVAGGSVAGGPVAGGPVAGGPGVASEPAPGAKIVPAAASPRSGHSSTRDAPGGAARSAPAAPSDARASSGAARPARGSGAAPVVVAVPAAPPAGSATSPPPANATAAAPQAPANAAPAKRPRKQGASEAYKTR